MNAYQLYASGYLSQYEMEAATLGRTLRGDSITALLEQAAQRQIDKADRCRAIATRNGCEFGGPLALAARLDQIALDILNLIPSTSAKQSRIADQVRTDQLYD